MSSRTTAEHDYWPEVVMMIDADIGSRFDLLTRYIMITAAGLLLYAVSGQLLMLAWLAFYLTTNASYCWMLSRASSPIYFAAFARLVGMNIVSSGSFSFMVLYLSVQPSLALQVVGICGLAGHAFFNLSRHATLTAVARWDAFSIVASCTFIGGVKAMQFDGELAQQGLILFGALAVATYYIVAQHSIFRVNAALEQAREEAAQTQKMRAIGQLTSGIAHDFNNLLTVMRGNVELAELAHTPKERLTALQETKDAADRAARLINHMLAFSRKAHLTPDVIDLRDFLPRFEQIARRILPANITLTLESGHDPVQVCCDQAQLETALLNLAINARDAMADTDGDIHISASIMNPSALHKVTSLSKDRKYARITISDTGPGVDPEVINRMTDPFFTTKPVGQGSGLGLSMVKGFAEQSGGTTLFASPPRGGLHVYMILPTGCEFLDLSAAS
jgi:signal transduction histidine kinase